VANLRSAQVQNIVDENAYNLPAPRPSAGGGGGTVDQGNAGLFPWLVTDPQVLAQLQTLNSLVPTVYDYIGGFTYDAILLQVDNRTYPDRVILLPTPETLQSGQSKSYVLLLAQG
jgi:hypothetical protein